MKNIPIILVALLVGCLAVTCKKEETKPATTPPLPPPPYVCTDEIQDLETTVYQDIPNEYDIWYNHVTGKASAYKGKNYWRASTCGIIQAIEGKKVFSMECLSFSDDEYKFPRESISFGYVPLAIGKYYKFKNSRYLEEGNKDISVGNSTDGDDGCVTAEVLLLADAPTNYLEVVSYDSTTHLLKGRYSFTFAYDDNFNGIPDNDNRIKFSCGEFDVTLKEQ